MRSFRHGAFLGLEKHQRRPALLINPFSPPSKAQAETLDKELTRITALAQRTLEHLEAPAQPRAAAAQDPKRHRRLSGCNYVYSSYRLKRPTHGLNNA